MTNRPTTALAGAAAAGEIVSASIDECVIRRSWTRTRTSAAAHPSHAPAMSASSFVASLASRPAAVRVAPGRRSAGAAPRRGAAVARRATVPEKPTEADFALFNDVVGGGDWNLVQEKVRAAAVDGRLTPGVLGAAYSVYEKCKDLGEDQPVLKTLENVILLITQTLQQLDATPAVRLIDELMTMDPVADADAVRDRIQSAKEVTKGELAASLGMLLDGMSEQDEAFDAQVTKAAETEDPAEFQRILEHANGRMEAKRRLATLKEICEA